MIGAARVHHGVVLLVEDQEGTRQPMTRLLGLRGFPVLEAANGAEAWNVLRSEVTFASSCSISCCRR